MIDPQLEAALAAAARVGVLLVASDYDGTLSHLVDDPSAARPHQPALAALSGLGRLPGVVAVLISGRSLEALEHLAGSPPDVQLIGTHGTESSDTRTRPEIPRLVSSVVSDLKAVEHAFEGTLLEEKPAGAALHYRHATDQQGAAEAARAVGARQGVRTIDGKMVVELLVGEGDKGTALEAVRDASGAERLVFFGDDTTDEDVFLAARPGDVSVKVGDGPTAAQYRVDDPRQVGEALAILLEVRQSASG